MSVSEVCRGQVVQLLSEIYGAEDTSLVNEVLALVEDRQKLNVGPDGELWNENDVVLITYGDQVLSDDPGKSALAAQRGFLNAQGFGELLSTVHLLPFFPYTSDDGFSISDYLAVNPDAGDWTDVSGLASDYDLMFDLVLNHCSQAHEWFTEFRKGLTPGCDFFHAKDPSLDLSAVTRPRVSRLLTPYQTVNGVQHVWTTFSGDQVDLNYECPGLLVEMLKVLIEYADRGARIIRLDAIAYLWKQIGTSCIHLPQTHAVVKLMRCLLDEVAPGCIVLTETNVPHQENVSYFGNGDEAQMVYQFSLAPLLLDAMLTGDAAPLNSWLANLEPCQPGNTYLNFTASHDGVGVRPLEGLVEPERLDALVKAVRSREGLVSCKRNADGSDSPYELNITYFSALGDRKLSIGQHAQRFLSTQSIMLGLQGVPAVYFHSLVGTPNFQQGVQETGRARTINRRKFGESELMETVTAEGTAQAAVFEGYKKLLSVRRQQSAFHPDVPQRVLSEAQSALVGFVREPSDEHHRVLVASNVTAEKQIVDFSGEFGTSPLVDLISGDSHHSSRVELNPWQAVWLKIA